MVKARKPRRKQEERSRPSTFFLVLLVIGFLVLVWWFVHFLPGRATGEDDQQNTALPSRCEAVG